MGSWCSLLHNRPEILMLASLPMYDLPELRSETDALWSAVAHGLRARGIDAPGRLTRSGDLHSDWMRPDLLLSQTCGLPFVRHLRGRVDLVGAVAYDLPDCAPGTYRSRVVVRADDPRETIEAFRGAAFAMNSEGSQSGAGAMRTLVGPLRREAGWSKPGPTPRPWWRSWKGTPTSRRSTP
jgi:hypothetical protein